MDKYSLRCPARFIILGPLLVNIFLCDFFSILRNIDIASYTDDNTTCIMSKTTGTVYSCQLFQHFICKMQNIFEMSIRGNTIVGCKETLENQQ